MQIESLLKQSTRVGLENADELANFLMTWAGTTPASADGMTRDGEASAEPLDRDEVAIQIDSSASQVPVAGTARSKRQAVKPGLPPRVARWEQMQSGQQRSGGVRQFTNQD